MSIDINLRNRVRLHKFHIEHLLDFRLKEKVVHHCLFDHLSVGMGFFVFFVEPFIYTLKG